METKFTEKQINWLQTQFIANWNEMQRKDEEMLEITYKRTCRQILGDVELLAEATEVMNKECKFYTFVDGFPVAK